MALGSLAAEPDKETLTSVAMTELVTLTRLLLSIVKV
jgi:hypothetical protein